MAKILFIDDDPYTLATYQRAVEIFGHKAVIANSANEALDLVDSETLDLIILDKNMPDMDGFALIEKLNERLSTDEIPIVMISADPEEQAMADAIKAGAMTYISKPIRLDTLIELIQEYTTSDSTQ